jgi:hypothetical protein
MEPEEHGLHESKHCRTHEDYLTDRVQRKIRRYDQRAKKHRNRYYFLAILAAALAALLPALLNIKWVPSWVSALVSVAIAIAVALDRIFRPMEHWLNYDLMSEYLVGQEMCFSTRTGEYSRTDRCGDPTRSEDEVFAKFVGRVEDAIAKERAETLVRSPGVNELSNLNENVKNLEEVRHEKS